MKIAITGASGFIGSRLARHILDTGHQLVAIDREAIEVPDFQGASTVIHCAGLAHGAYPAVEHDRVNNRMATSLAEAAAIAGIQRFVFVSSINVVAGNSGRLLPDMSYAPIGALGEAKAKAEQVLLARPAGMEIVIVRPTLTYGPGVRGNLGSLMALIDNPLPMPFDENQRSMVSVGNLASALVFLATTDRGIDRRIFHVTDGPLSTASIAYWARTGMGRAPRIAGFLSKPARIMLRLLGRGRMADLVYGDLLVDGTDLLNAGWTPNSVTAEELASMGRVWQKADRPERSTRPPLRGR